MVLVSSLKINSNIVMTFFVADHFACSGVDFAFHE
jgi:hypothetical protein